MTTLADSDKTQIRARLSYLISQASLSYTSLYDGKLITTADLVNQFKDKIAVELANGSKVILVAHSQGNFFANDAYTAVVANLPAAQSQGLAVANIANPAPNAASGLYATITQDLIIQAARAQSALLLAQQPLFANLDASGANSIDRDGHGFVKVYLSTALQAIQRGVTRPMADWVIGLVQQSINLAIAPPVPQQCRVVAPVCTEVFTKTEYAQVVPGITIAQANSIFGCMSTTQAGTGWQLWSNGRTIFDPLQSQVAVTFTNGFYVAGNAKGTDGLIMP